VAVKLENKTAYLLHPSSPAKHRQFSNHQSLHTKYLVVNRLQIFEKDKMAYQIFSISTLWITYKITTQLLAIQEENRSYL
jgi:hypothetical protein